MGAASQMCSSSSKKKQAFLHPKTQLQSKSSRGETAVQWVANKRSKTHGNPKGHGPQHSEERGRKGRTGQPQPQPQATEAHLDRPSSRSSHSPCTGPPSTVCAQHGTRRCWGCCTGYCSKPHSSSRRQRQRRSAQRQQPAVSPTWTSSARHIISSVHCCLHHCTTVAAPSIVPKRTLYQSYIPNKYTPQTNTRVQVVQCLELLG